MREMRYVARPVRRFALVMPPASGRGLLDGSLPHIDKKLDTVTLTI
jgi:hypothetical protein